MNNGSFLSVPLHEPLTSALDPMVFRFFLTKPIIQNMRQAVSAAAMQPIAANKPPGSSNSFRAVPHSSSDSSWPDGQFERPVWDEENSIGINEIAPVQELGNNVGVRGCLCNNKGED